jgi:hypothetical protein
MTSSPVNSSNGKPRQRLSLTPTKIVAGVLLLGAIAYGSACAYLASKQRALIFNPRTDIRIHPDQAPIHLRYEAVRIPVSPSTTAIRGWWIPHNPQRSVSSILGGGGGIAVIT